MKQLLLLRHAEAQASSTGGTDFDRPLSSYGRDQARSVAQRLRAAQLSPSWVLVSPALRTRETAALIAAELACTPTILPAPALYLGGPEELLTVLRGCPADSPIVMLIGHNPAISALAQGLLHAVALERAAGDPGAGPIDTSQWQLGTAGCCRLQLEMGGWSELGPERLRGASLIS